MSNATRTQRQRRARTRAASDTHWLRRVTTLACLLTCAVAGFTWAQPATTTDPAAAQALLKSAAADAEEANGKPDVSIDTERMLQDSHIFAKRAGDSIWTFTPKPGWELMRIPVRIKTTDANYTLDNRTLDIASARVLAWQIPTAAELKADEVKTRSSTTDTDNAQHPLVAKSMEVHADGTIHWDMDRAILGGEVTNSRYLYALKLNPRLMEARRPKDPNDNRRIVRPPVRRPSSSTTRRPSSSSTPRQPPPRKTPAQLRAERERKIREAEQARKEREQKRAAELKYRAAMAEYGDLRRQVNDLPTEFEQKKPPFVWAIVEISQRADELTIAGAIEPGWTIGMQTLEDIRALPRRRVPSVRTKAGDPKPPLPAFIRDASLGMHDLLKRQPHPFNYQLVAYVGAEIDLLQYAEPDNAVYNLYDALVKGPDGDARAVVVKQVVATIPPTEATTKLFKENTGLLNPADRLALVKSKLNFNPNKVDEVQRMLKSANTSLADPQGPEPKNILSTALAGGKLPANARAAVQRGIVFSHMPANRRDAAIAYALQTAPFDPVAAGWVDTQLLGSSDVKLVIRTLELLTGKAGAVKPEAVAQDGTGVRGNLRSTLLRTVQKATTAQQNAADNALNTDANTGPPVVKMTGKIPVTATSHKLFDALRHVDARVPPLTWDALEHFKFVDPARASSSALTENNPYQLIEDIALEKQPTPVQVVPFLAAQSNLDRATKGLVAIVISGTTDASTAAVRTLVGWKGPLDVAILRLEPARRQAFSERVYVRLEGARPLVTGLTRERIADSPVNRWFAKRLMAGSIPTAGEWVEPFDRNDKLVELIASDDARQAQGALAALVAAHGGDDATTATLSRRFLALPDKSLPKVQVEWARAQRELIGKVYARVQGPYTLRIERPADAKPDHPVTESIELGRVELTITGSSPKFRGLNTELSLPAVAGGVALQFNRAAQLGDFAAPAAAKLQLNQLKSQVVLNLREGDFWTGLATLPSGQPVVVALRPIGLR